MEESNQEINKQKQIEEIKVEEAEKKERNKPRFNPRRRLKVRILKKISYFSRNGITYIDYKDINTLNRFINRQGQIIPRTFNRLTTKEQRLTAQAIRRARQMALMPYVIIEQNIF
jgi:small subunit ribosomal protein S18